jgi:hypothetical protein
MDAYTIVGKTYYPGGVSRDFRPRGSPIFVRMMKKLAKRAK